MPVTVTTGKGILAADINILIADVNSMLTTYGYSADVASVSPGGSALSSLIDTLKSKLQTCNTIPKNRSPSDLSGITGYNVGATVFASLINLIDQKALEIKSNYCSCNCNYCTCNCNYCTCDCDVCSCNCNYCTCNCNYSCTCNCNFTCYCTIDTRHVCIAPGTLVMTSAGPRVVEEIEEGDYVLTGQGTYSKVIATWPIKNCRGVLVTYSGPSYSIAISDDHPLVVFDTWTQQITKAAYTDIVKYPRRYSATLPKINKNRTKFDQGDAYRIREDIVLPASLVELIPYLIIGGALTEHGYAIRCSVDRVEAVTSLIQQTFGDIPVIADYQSVIIPRSTFIGDLPIETVIDICTSHYGLPPWIFDYSDETLTKFLMALQDVISSDTIDERLLFAIRLIAIQTGTDVHIGGVHICGTSARRFNRFTLLPIENVSIAPYLDLLYNIVTEDSDSVVASITLGDGFSSL